MQHYIKNNILTLMFLLLPVLGLKAQLGGGGTYTISQSNVAYVGQSTVFTLSGPNLLGANSWNAFGGNVSTTTGLSTTVSWTTAGNAFVGVNAVDVFFDVYYTSKFLTVYNPPSTPPSPTITQYCGYTRLTRATPPSGITYYWQSTSSGTSTSLSSSYVDRTSGTFYYLRARDNTSGAWSSARSVNYSINNNPPTPSSNVTITNNCGSTVLTRATPPSGETWYWQSSSSGTSTSNSSSSITLTSGSVYYLRAKKNSSNCWSPARIVLYSVNNFPSTPSSPSVTNNCGSTVLTRGTPPSGVTWYWQSSSSGTSTSNSASSITRTSGSVYYLRARNNTTGCWSSTRTVNYSVNTVPGTPSAPTVTNNCGDVVLTRGTPPSGTTWYWQSSSSGTSTSNSAASITLTSGSVYYLRAKNNAAACWSTTRTVNYTITTNTYYYDNDGDGLGAGSAVTGCTAPAGTVTNNSDLDDSSALITNIAPQTWYSDVDGDGYGDGTSTVQASFQRLGWSANNTDPCPTEAGPNGCPTATGVAISADQNYIHTKVFQDVNSADPIETVSYFDGIGRTKQDIALKASGTITAKSPNTASGWSMDWTLGSGSTAFFNQNGATSENSRIQAPGPYGNSAVIWECGNDTASDADGGYNTDYFNVDKTKTYRYTVWVRRNHSQDGSTYHGTQNVDNLSGGANGNPYFWSGDLPQLDTWYLLVGIVHPHTHGSTDTGVSGVYDIQGNQVLPGTEFKWRSDTTTARFRSYLYYCTDVNVRQYFHDPTLEVVDGTERPLAQFFGNSGSKDIVTIATYDDFGRQEKAWLPMAAPGVSGSYRTGDMETSTKQYYKNYYGADFLGVTTANVNAFSETEFEQSPLNRTLKQAAPGYDWRMGGGHEIEFAYASNTFDSGNPGNASNDNVRYYKVTTTFANNTYTPTLVADGYYAEGELWKNTTYDENHTAGTNHSMEEYTDKEGRVVLKRTYNNGAHDTYYVYDDFGNLTYVLPPKVVHDSSISTNELNELCYQYKYDHRNRLVEKKIPGKDWEYIIYNTLDQPVMTQDGNQRPNKEWLFTKYDAFGRVAYTGLHTQTNVISRTTMQGYVTANANQYTARSAENNIAGTLMFYSNTASPGSISEVYTINYYDSYVDTDGQSVPATVLGQTTTTNVQGLPTVSKVRVLGTNNWITTITGYDFKGRAIYTSSKNSYLSTTDVVETKLDFTGRPEQVVASHTKGSNAVIVTTDNFTYDHMGRLLTQTQTLGGHTETLVENSYDELGQLVEKKVGGGLQTVDYQYNVRGWLKQINDPNSLGNDLFAFGINYSSPTHGGTALFNGNIAEVEWRTASLDNALKHYRYSYDALNRITEAIDNTGKFNLTGITYDKMGNIETLKRQGWTSASPSLANNTGLGTMDDLVYTYDSGNKLTNVADNNASDTYGFVDANGSGTEYTYDVNGNMTSDANKGITSISYNHLNLPTNISINDNGNTGTISYIYDATGVKLEKKVVESGNPNQYTFYAGNHIYTRAGDSGNGSLQFFNQPEGYVNPDGQGGYEYVYQYKDHLGNVRLSFVNNNGTTQIVEENNYYPFGLEHKGYNNQINGIENNYMTYNGKELDESLRLNWIDYGWRNYNPDLGRWVNIDNLAGIMKSYSPYNYAFNSPIYYIDIDGLHPGNNEDADKKGYIRAPDGTVYFHPEVNENTNLPKGYTYLGEVYLNWDTSTLWGPNGTPISQIPIRLEEVVVCGNCDNGSQSGNPTSWGVGTEDRGPRGKRRGELNYNDLPGPGSLKGGGNSWKRFIEWLTGTFSRATEVQQVVITPPTPKSNPSTMENKPEAEPIATDPYAFNVFGFSNNGQQTIIWENQSHDFFVPRHGVEGAFQNAVRAADSTLSNNEQMDSVSVRAFVIKKGQNLTSTVQDTTIRRQ